VLVTYGAILAGRGFDQIILLDPPTSKQERQWVELAQCRLHRGGGIIHAYSLLGPNAPMAEGPER
jgi:hypothetical protein